MKIKKFNIIKLAVYLLFSAVILFAFSGCVYGDNPDATDPVFVDQIGDNSTPANTHKVIIPTENPDNSTSAPYDPVINFTDPYFEIVVRDILGKSIGDITIADVSGIKTIKARVKGIRNINDIVYFTSLEELDLYGNKINDIAPLGRLTELKRLNIGKNFNTLYSSGTGGMNLNVLASLPLLEELYAEDNQISDITFVQGLLQLKVLNLANNNLTNIDAVSGLVNLENLVISNNKITDLGVLESCIKLSYLDVSNNYFEVLDPETSFYTGYGVKDLSFAKKLVNLAYLNISSNMVTSLEPIAGLKTLRSVFADDNYITDIRYFKGNTTLQLLSVKRNYIKDFSVVSGMKSLTELFYIGNPVADTAPLKNFELQNQ